MNQLLKPILPPETAGKTKRAVIFMSGVGSNALSLLEYSAEHKNCGFEIVGIFTDRPKECRANQIGLKYQIPVLACDIKDFYAKHGESGIALISERRRKLREDWTNLVRELIEVFHADFITLAGFIPLCNIAQDYPTLNVHPGNLLIEEDGRRLLAGLHYIPVETAILRGFGTLRSSVILAQAFSGSGNEMDTGPILGVSAAIPVDLLGNSLDDLAIINAHRPAGANRSGEADQLRKVAQRNIENLKKLGDHIVFPRVVEALSRGSYMLDSTGTLYFGTEAVQTVEFGVGSIKPIKVSK